MYRCTVLRDHAVPPGAGARADLLRPCIAHVPVRRWVLSLPIALRLLLAAQPLLVTAVLQVVHRVITRFLLDQAGLKAGQADSGAVTLIQHRVRPWRPRRRRGCPRPRA